MVIINELSVEWASLGLDSTQSVSPTEGPFLIPAGDLRYIPSEKHIFRAKMGILELFHGTFDHPMCGIRIENGESEGDYNSGTIYNIRNYIFGSQRKAHTDVTVMIPPDVPYGFYSIKRLTSWKWEKWLRLALINIDSIDHYCLGYGYSINKLTGTKGTPLKTL